jgi:hypothetical protein
VPSAGTSSSGIIKRLLASPRATIAILVVALALAAPSLTTGLTADDWIQQVIARGQQASLPGLAPSRLDMFSFAGHAIGGNHAAVESGMFPWWTDAAAKLAFWRPLTSLTHLADWTLWPSSPVAMHVHNLAWFALALWAAAAFYRRFCVQPWVAGLATLLYAVDDAHGPALGWVANRNAMVALALALPVVVVHDRWRRDGWRAGRWLGPALLGVALLAGEAALAVTAYLFAHALHLDEGRLRDRLLRLGPYALVVVAWRALYVKLGYGTFGSGVYLDPGSDPAGFVRALPDRAVALLAGQLLLPWSDFAGIWPFVSAHAARMGLLVSAAAVALVTAIVAPLVGRDRTARFFATGTLLAVVPICSTFPADRLLMFVGVGAMGLIASWLGAIPRGLIGYASAAILILVHLVLAPPLLALRARSMDTVDRPLKRADESLPMTPDIAARTVVLVNPPADFFAGYLTIRRAALGLPRPRLRWLASGTSRIVVTREDARTLRVVPSEGFMPHISEQMLRSLKRPFARGERVQLGGFTVEILELLPDGRPAAARFVFEVPLEDASLYFASWQGRGYGPWAPPAIGQTATLEPAGFIEAVFAK